MAVGELGNDLTRMKLTLTLLGDVSAKRAIAYLIADYSLTCQPNWDAAKSTVLIKILAFISLPTGKAQAILPVISERLDNALKADPDYIARKAGVFIT